MMGWRIRWIDAGREPRVAPNPAYPNGIDVDCSNRASKSCKVLLPYPAKRCGYYDIGCAICGAGVMVTTAGRADDPRSVRIACDPKGCDVRRPFRS